jgi:hypothetical protein
MITRREAVVGLFGGGLAHLARSAEAAPIAKRTSSFGDTGTFIQPAYDKWKQVKVGMTEDEVTELLGPPLLQPESDPEFDKDARVRGENTGYPWLFGWLEFKHPSVPDAQRFDVYFQQRKVLLITDPFNRDLSADGKPTVPKLVVPVSEAILRHFPRYLDLRWLPPSGEYPMSFEVEVEIGQRSDDADTTDVRGKKYEFHSAGAQRVYAPYAVFTFGGKNLGRWRVRASNKIGTSDWSDHRYFQFEV